MTSAPRVGVVGAGYVGLTTAGCVAGRGLNTVAVDVDADRVQQLAAGISVLDEAELPKLLRDGISQGLLSCSVDYSVLADRDLVFVCVPAPSAENGEPDLRAVQSVVDRLGGVLR